jgi:hypothetical protein
MFNKKGGDAVQGRFVSDEALRATPAMGFQSGGLNAQFRHEQTGQRRFSLTRGQGVNDVLARFGEVGRNTAADFRGLREQVQPGFSRLRDARLGSLGDAERRSIGGLKESLRARRLGGSSFENLAISDERNRFALLRDEIETSTFTAELEMTRQLIANEFEAVIPAIMAELEQFNFETSIGADLAKAGTALQSNIVAARAGVSTASAQAESVTQQGKGALLEPMIDVLGKGVEDIFKGVITKILPSTPSGGGVK